MLSTFLRQTLTLAGFMQLQRELGQKASRSKIDPDLRLRKDAGNIRRGDEKREEPKQINSYHRAMQEKWILFWVSMKGGILNSSIFHWLVYSPVVRNMGRTPKRSAKRFEGSAPANTSAGGPRIITSYVVFLNDIRRVYIVS